MSFSSFYVLGVTIWKLCLYSLVKVLICCGDNCSCSVTFYNDFSFLFFLSLNISCYSNTCFVADFNLFIIFYDFYLKILNYYSKIRLFSCMFFSSSSYFLWSIINCIVFYNYLILDSLNNLNLGLSKFLKNLLYYFLIPSDWMFSLLLLASSMSESLSPLFYFPEEVHN